MIYLQSIVSILAQLGLFVESSSNNHNLDLSLGISLCSSASGLIHHIHCDDSKLPNKERPVAKLPMLFSVRLVTTLFAYSLYTFDLTN
ncbi:hypothetical protein WN943_003249 [Citrus x changshan-huyou]